MIMDCQPIIFVTFCTTNDRSRNEKKKIKITDEGNMCERYKNKEYEEEYEIKSVAAYEKGACIACGGLSCVSVSIVE